MKTNLCAGLIHNNTRCPKADQCAHWVAWHEDKRAAFNRCASWPVTTYPHFLPKGKAIAAPVSKAGQIDLFAEVPA